MLVGVRRDVAALGCFFADGPVALEAEVLFYTPTQCPPREACAGRRLVCVPHFPRAADGAIDVEALRNLAPREPTGRPPPAAAAGAERLSSGAGVLSLVAEAVAQAFGGSTAAEGLDAETDLFEAGLSSLT